MFRRGRHGKSLNGSSPARERSRASARSGGILDPGTLEEQSYDEITKLASFICETPIALITLVDRERQWFKSRLGLQATQTPREHAFCAHAILELPEVLVVHDASADPRFGDNPLVMGEPRIRFYAEAPLVAPSGEALGTVCVIDRVPRELPLEKIDAPRALSRQVVAHLELRKALRDLESKHEEQRAYQRQLEDYQREIESINAQLVDQNVTDGLTGVKNRHAFDERLSDELARAARTDAPLSLLLLDIDRFKDYNDQYGHSAGDDVLRRVGGILSHHARPFDLVARYPGLFTRSLLQRRDHPC